MFLVAVLPRSTLVIEAVTLFPTFASIRIRQLLFTIFWSYSATASFSLFLSTDIINNKQNPQKFQSSSGLNNKQIHFHFANLKSSKQQKNV